jgi:putative MATE family efflux protein
MSRTEKYNLTEGGIGSKLFLVALPLMGTQILQMTYNLTDMFWLGRLSSDAVVSAGIVGFYLWLSVAFFLFGRMGAEIGVSQNIGKGDTEKALAFGYNAVLLSLVIGILLAAIFIVAQEPLIGFFGIQESHVARDAQSYLSIVSFGLPLVFVSLAIAGIFAGTGNTRLPMVISAIGFGVNMVLTPILVFIANLGIIGAAIATLFANAVGFGASLYALIHNSASLFKGIKFKKRPDFDIIRQIFKWVAPVSFESFVFTFLSMMITALIAMYGSGALAASRVASQIESLTWLIAGGFATALTTYTGQNFGAKKWSRIHKGFTVSTGLMMGWGAIVTLILLFGGSALLRIFLPNDPDIVDIGARYLRILAIIQIPACLEGVAAGIFRGQGKTLPPSISSVSSNILRVILAYCFTYFTDLGLDGLWIAVSVSAGIRGVWIFIWYLLYSRRLPEKDTKQSEAGIECEAGG